MQELQNNFNKLVHKINKNYKSLIDNVKIYCLKQMVGTELNF